MYKYIQQFAITRISNLRSDGSDGTDGSDGEPK